MAKNDDRNAETELMEQALMLTELAVVDTKVQHLAGNTTVRIEMREDPDLIAGCAFGLLFAISAISFKDARPRGGSEMDYSKVDVWTPGDLVGHLCYKRGSVVFHADYVRGRMMKTTVEIDRDGRISLETENRGEVATRWVATLQGKRVIALVDDATPIPERPTARPLQVLRSLET